MTLSRFFVIHVMVLPAALMGLAGLHLFLFRKAGPAGPFRGSVGGNQGQDRLFLSRVKSGKTWSGWSLVFLIICSLAFWEPVVLLEEATPDPGDYHPEPEWYFLFLFQLLRLKVFAGEFGQFLGAIALPGAFMALLAALPFIDRSPERNIFQATDRLDRMDCGHGDHSDLHRGGNHQPRIFGLGGGPRAHDWSRDDVVIQIRAQYSLACLLDRAADQDGLCPVVHGDGDHPYRDHPRGDVLDAADESGQRLCLFRHLSGSRIPFRGGNGLAASCSCSRFRSIFGPWACGANLLFRATAT